MKDASVALIRIAAKTSIMDAHTFPVNQSPDKCNLNHMLIVYRIDANGGML